NDSNSIDESIASRAVLTHPADLIINVVDATSLERSLYMTLQLRELGRPMIVVLNKMDALKRERQMINVAELEKTLGCPVVSLSATNKTQVAEFKEKLHKSIVQGVPLKELSLHYGEKMESAIQTVSALFDDQHVAHRALAIRALEKDTMVLNSLSDIDRSKVLEVITTLDLDIDLHVADTKYTHLHEQCKKV
ncbi:FeoB small GTPase domain-containing protein, partial [Vibrio parahaemolyticus]|nr:FeoB small GTPase domain-containing protein [Vibrio parahaemolyticus]